MSNQAAEHMSANVKRRRRRIWPGVLLIIVLLILAVAGAAAYTASRFYSQAKEVKAHEEQALQIIGGFSDVSDPEGLKKLADQIPKAQEHTAAARSIAHGDLWDRATSMPRIGDDVTTIQGMTVVLDELANESVPQFINIANKLNSENLSTPDGGINIKPILDVQQQILDTNTFLQTQVDAYNELPEPSIEQVQQAYHSGQTQLESVAGRVEELSNAFQILPEFLGSNGQQTYAVLAVTSSEMRSAGGLVGSIGTMVTDNGKINVGDFRSNAEYLPYGYADSNSDETALFKSWGPLKMSFDIRDIALFPDTSRTTEAMQSIWQRTYWGSGQPLSGVILVDPVFLQELVKITGDITVENGPVLTGDNTAEFLLNTVYKEYPVYMQDSVFQLIASQTLNKVFSDMNLKKLMQISDIMKTSAQGRHFSMFSNDETMQKNIEQSGLTASVPSSEENPEIGVYLNEQNPSKLGWYIHRTSNIVRQSCNEDGSQTYHVTYTMMNTLDSGEVSSLPEYVVGYGQQGTGIEKTLLYAPAGGSISNLSVNGDIDAPKEWSMGGRNLYATLARIAPGAEVSMSFDVTTSTKAKTDIDVDQTPMGWLDPGVTIDTAACKIGG